MFCSNCGAEISDGAKFCDSCGTPVGTGDADKTAVVMSAVALVAVVALVVVVANPFGGSRNEPAQSAQEQPVDDSAPAGEESEASDEGAEKDEAADAAEADSEDEASADDASEDAAGTQQNNVVVVVEGNDRAPAPPASTVVHVSDDYILPYSATYEYSTSEISHLSDWELYLARNEIYARHGREFRNDDLVRYFGDKSWYTPIYSPDDFDARVDSFLSYTEQRNAATILALEQARGSAYI
ncbi:YARHG domain-containing protein [Thermophilibacter provencensis]|uniref:YARHG domain-containing protein n=1 Tax=Thermophilibacter provencensis TaxID=1852386 RepID=UPI00094A9F6D|nr:YARHG domain-containing protein [Thermophilibacter provencensis]